MRGFDCNCKLSYEKALQFKKAGYDFVIRYVGRMEQASFDIDKTEVDNILRAGLELAIVQHVEKAGWIPLAEKGTTYGKNAVKFAHEAGITPGVSLYLDLESTKAGTPNQSIIDYCNAWYDQVIHDYLASGYIGCDIGLTGDELYHKLKFKDYWRSASNVPDIPERGYEMSQGLSVTVNGISIDPDTVTGDNKGNFPVFMVPEKLLTHIINVYNDGSCDVK